MYIILAKKHNTNNEQDILVGKIMEAWAEIKDDMFLAIGSIEKIKSLPNITIESKMPLCNAIELVAIIDESKKCAFNNFPHKKPDGANFLQLGENDKISLVNHSDVKLLLANLTIKDNLSIRPILEKIRATEAYMILIFLISMNGSEKSLTEMSKKYGLSATYFRYLCRINFKISAKKKMMLWRLSSAILQLIESDKSIIDVAMENGYCSASHLTQDVKKILGITPTKIRCLEKNVYGNQPNE